MALSAGFALFGIAALPLAAVLPAALSLLPVCSAWGDVVGPVRWPMMAGIAILALAIVCRHAPARAEARWQWISWGAAVATALWISGSIASTIYVSKVGSYDKTTVRLAASSSCMCWSPARSCYAPRSLALRGCPSA